MTVPLLLEWRSGEMSMMKRCERADERKKRKGEERKHGERRESVTDDNSEKEREESGKWKWNRIVRKRERCWNIEKVDMEALWVPWIADASTQREAVGVVYFGHSCGCLTIGLGIVHCQWLTVITMLSPASWFHPPPCQRGVPCHIHTNTL